jgi:peptidase E
MVACGPNILTSSDMNSVATTRFDGLNVLPFNFFAHYNDDVHQDEWLAEYHMFNDNPVIMVSDGAYVRVEGKKTTLVRGEAWILRKDSEKEKLREGEIITL